MPAITFALGNLTNDSKRLEELTVIFTLGLILGGSTYRTIFVRDASRRDCPLAFLRYGLQDETIHGREYENLPCEARHAGGD